MLKINGTNGILDDNSYLYLLFLNAVVVHADPDANIRIEKFEDQLKITVFPAVPEFREAILDNILSIHKIFNIKTNFAKSTKITRNLYFDVNLVN